MKSVSTLLGKVLLGMLAAAPLLSAAQTTEKYQPKDSINVRDKHMFRQWSYEQNNSAYPAPKKDNWSIGLQGGPSWVSGDVRPELGWSGGLNVRRSMGHLLSIRIGALAGCTKGLNWQPSGGFLQNTALNGAENANSNYTTATYPLVFYNFKMRYFAANADLVASLNNINFYNKEPRIGLHVYGGIGFVTYGTYVDALNAGGSMYNYSGVPVGTVLDDKADALNALDNLLDGEYETEADEYYNKAEFLNGTCVPTLSLGGGVSYKLSRRMDLMLDYRATITNDDLLDGQRWEETNTLSSGFDVLNNASIGINFRLGKGEDSKWWTNPLDASFSSIRTLKSMSNKETADSDGDGVVDALDKESGTPKGARVDSHGKALDSDGDGVQDFRDREPFSLAGAEVDRDGIALDGDGDGVPNLLDREPNSAAGAQVDVRGVTIKAAGTGTVAAVPATLPMVHFDYNSTEVKTQYFEELMEVAKMMRDNPSMKLRVTGHTDVRNSNNKNDDLSKARAESVANLMATRFGVDKSRMIVEFKGATQPLVTVPADRDPKNEPMHNLNRRVEFEIVK